MNRYAAERNVLLTVERDENFLPNFERCAGVADKVHAVIFCDVNLSIEVERNFLYQKEIQFIDFCHLVNACFNVSWLNDPLQDFF